MRNKGDNRALDPFTLCKIHLFFFFFFFQATKRLYHKLYLETSETKEEREGSRIGQMKQISLSTPPNHIFLFMFLYQTKPSTQLLGARTLMLYFSELSDDLSMGNAKQSQVPVSTLSIKLKRNLILSTTSFFFFFARLLLAHSYKVKLCRLILMASKSAL